ncbi:hypothetical protein E2C01_051299 [Portunus trituberculatus]|uniref:Uncharacterized protein n=1 Tax=Portunus trituberculatus TaxID=210409 RepID=A0A5B7GB75_PORTR|nr:hypothetical protein [Portunus trituberculatus]
MPAARTAPRTACTLPPRAAAANLRSSHKDAEGKHESERAPRSRWWVRTWRQTEDNGNVGSGEDVSGASSRFLNRPQVAGETTQGMHRQAAASCAAHRLVTLTLPRRRMSLLRADPPPCIASVQHDPHAAKL